VSAFLCLLLWQALSPIFDILRLGLLIEHPEHRWARPIPTLEPPTGTSRPILKLSAEILSYIFLLCRDDLRTEADIFDDVVVGLFDWVQVTAVCRAWRQTALGTQGLWSRIEMDRPLSVDPMLVRSGSASLTIVSRERNPTYKPQVWNSVLTQMPRIRELDLLLSREDAVAHVLEGLATRDAPRLEKIFIRCDAETRRYSGPPSKERSLGLHATKAPTLRVLSLYGLDPRGLGHQLLRALTHFRLHYATTGSARSPIKFSEFLNILRDMPSLVFLSLGHPFSEGSVPTADTAPLPPVALPQLRDLRLLLYEEKTCVTFYRHLQIPPTTTVYLDCGTGEALTEAVYAERCTEFAGAGAPIRTVRLLGIGKADCIQAFTADWEGPLLRGWEDIYHPDVDYHHHGLCRPHGYIVGLRTGLHAKYCTDDSEGRPVLQYRSYVHWPETQDARLRGLGALFRFTRAMPMETVTTLHVQHPLSGQEWSELLAACPRLQRLYVGHCPKDLFHRLSKQEATTAVHTLAFENPEKLMTTRELEWLVEWLRRRARPHGPEPRLECLYIMRGLVSVTAMLEVWMPYTTVRIDPDVMIHEQAHDVGNEGEDEDEDEEVDEDEDEDNNENEDEGDDDDDDDDDEGKSIHSSEDFTDESVKDD
jgi:hypothetical protein